MIEPINFVGAIRQRWKLILVLAVIGAVIAVAIPASKPKHMATPLKFETYATVGAPASNGLALGTVSNAQILFYANTFPVKLAAVKDTNLTGNPYVYAGGMFGTTVAPTAKAGYPTTPPQTPTGGKQAAAGEVTLYAAGPTATIAAELCNNYARDLGDNLEQIAASRAADSSATSGRLTGGDSPFAVTATGFQVIFPGTPQLAHRINRPAVSTLSSKKVRLIIGLLGGALLGVAIVLAREVLNKSIRRSGRAQHHFKFPVIAEIPETYPPDPVVVDVVDRPTSPASEAYRKLRMSILFESLADISVSTSDPLAEMLGMNTPQIEAYEVPEPGSRSVLLVLSTIDEASRPKVVANLAATYAEAGEKVVVVSTGDLEVGTTFPVDSMLTGPITPADIEIRLAPAGPENVSTLSMRHFMRNSGQLVTRSKEVFDALRSVADVVLVEAPAFLRFHHGEAMVHSVDAVIVVAESGATQAPDAQDMGDILRRLGAPVLGVVFTGVELSASQRKVLAAGMAASGRSQSRATATASGLLDSADPEDGAVPEATPELHPS